MFVLFLCHFYLFQPLNLTYLSANHQPQQPYHFDLPIPHPNSPPPPFFFVFFLLRVLRLVLVCVFFASGFAAPPRVDLFDLQDPSDLETCAEMIFVERLLPVEVSRGYGAGNQLLSTPKSLKISKEQGIQAEGSMVNCFYVFCFFFRGREPLTFSNPFNLWGLLCT